jgi:hypothetical protein
VAQTKRKRRTKHRGNAAGIVESRGKTHKGGASTPSAKDQARDKRLARLDKPPTWQGSATRAAVAAVVFVVLVSLVFKRPVSESIALGGFVLLFYVPLGYFTDLTLYRRRQRSKQRAAQRDRAD